MPYKIRRTANGNWKLNEDGEVMVRDTDDDTIIWVPNNAIHFNEENKPFLEDSEGNVVALEYELEPNEATTKPSLRDSDGNVVAVKCDYEIPTDTEMDEAPEPEEAVHVNETITLALERPSTSKMHWNHQETVALIDAVRSIFEDFPHGKRQGEFWNRICDILGSQHIMINPSACKKKWENLLRTYKDIKDKLHKTGKGSTRFVYFESIENILGDAPNPTVHPVDVASLPGNNVNVTEAEEGTSTQEDRKTNDVKVSNNIKSFPLKAADSSYLERKTMFYNEMCASYKKYVTSSLRKKEEKLALMKRKLDLEERKVRALETLAKAVKEGKV